MLFFKGDQFIKIVWFLPQPFSLSVCIPSCVHDSVWLHINACPGQCQYVFEKVTNYCKMRSVCCSRELNIGRWSGTLSMLSLNYGHSQVKSWDKFQIVRLFHTKCKINSCVQIQLHYQSLLAFSLLPSDNDRHMFRPQFFLSFNMIHVQTDWQLFLTGGGVGQFSKPAWFLFLLYKSTCCIIFLVDHSLSKNIFFKTAS